MIPGNQEQKKSQTKKGLDAAIFIYKKIMRIDPDNYRDASPEFSQKSPAKTTGLIIVIR